MSHPIHAKSNEKLEENNWCKTSKQQKKYLKLNQNQAICHTRYLAIS